MVNPSAKGAAFEREVAIGLSLWLSGGERSDLLWRTAMSGGRATIKRRSGESAIAQAGDLCSIDEQSFWFTQKVFIEVKHLKDLNLTSFLLRKKGVLVRHLDKAREEAASEGKLLFFIAKQNRFPTVLVTPLVLSGLPPFVVQDLYFYNFDGFLSSYSPKTFLEDFLRAEREIDPE